MASVFENVQSILSAAGVAFESISHGPVSTSVESAAAQGVPLSATCKPMLVRFSRGSKEFYAVITIPGDRKLDLKKVKAVLKADDVKLAKLEQVPELTGCGMGAVPPFGHIPKMALLVDLALLSEKTVGLNAGTNTDSIRLSGKDLRAVLKREGAAGFDVSTG